MIKSTARARMGASLLSILVFGTARAVDPPPNTWEEQMSYLHGVIEGTCEGYIPDWEPYVGCKAGMWTNAANDYATWYNNSEVACNATSPSPPNCAALMIYLGHLVSETGSQASMWSSCS